MHRAATSQPKPIRYPGFGALFVGWTVLGVFAYARYTLLTGDWRKGILLELLGWLTCYYPWLFLTPLIFRLERSFPLGRLRMIRHVAVIAVTSFPLSYFAYELTVFLNAAIQYAFRESLLISKPWWWMPARELALEQALCWFTVGAACVIRNVIELREKERLAAQLALEKSELESSLRQAELETLRMRLNPHFLFNCLQNISTLSQKDPRTAAQMMTRLGDILRVALKRDSAAETTLEEELALTQAYVSIEKMRFQDRLSVLIDVAEGTERALVPTFLLQPLVENAIKHGLQNQQKIGLIWIRSLHQSNTLILTVSDNGSGISTERLAELELGIGLGSTCERLARMYQERQEFSIQRLPEGGTEVRIVLPLRLRSAAQKTPLNEQPSRVDRR
jgi:two-component system LytT family sensor kinase